MNKTDLIKLYDNKYVRSLIQLVPFGVGSVVDTYLIETIDKIQKERLETFFNQLENGQIELTDELIKSEDFLHNYFSTVRIVLNTRRREKITLIGNLFNSAINISIINEESESYEKNLKILDELSFFEIQILQVLKGLEDSKTTIKDGDDRWSKLKANQTIWKEFENNMFNDFEIARNGLDEILIRIERTGCLYIPRISANDYRPYCAITTTIFNELLNLIINKKQ